MRGIRFESAFSRISDIATLKPERRERSFRKYAEMKLTNVAGAKEALREFGAV
jgi:hypothetical protein